MQRTRTTIVIAGVAVLAFLTGCTATVGGQATTPPTSSKAVISTSTTTKGPTTTGPTPSSSCPTVYADPSIAFEPALADGGVLAVGDTGWINMSGTTDDITVTGTPDAVSLADRRIETFRSCDQTSTVSWVEVTALAPGNVTLTISGQKAKALRITVGSR